MKQILLSLSIIAMITSCRQQPIDVDTNYDEYPKTDASLWLDYAPERTVFKLWSPVAKAVKLRLYENGHDEAAIEIHDMQVGEDYVWTLEVAGDLNGRYYTYQVLTTDGPLLETPGIYATAVGVNGHRALVLDHAATNPEGWEQDEQVILSSPNDAVIYELHVRDITIHPNSGSSHPGKYLGLVEPGTRGPQDVFTAIDHIKELGITHVHLLPSYDHYSIDETRLDSAQFNWGYDPQNYNVPEGSYSSDPYNAEVRVKEFKQMVKAFHNAGIGVILDVVYNHTGKTEEANFNQEVPGYYYRHNDDGSWSDASACGNETASERPMMRKFMRESVDYWAREYHLDGFRFDLMGIHDIETMNLITDDLKKLNPNIFVYGEGWTGGDSPLPYDQRALKAHTQQTPQLSAFSDDIRDGLKGSVFDEHDTGFVTGKLGMEYSILFGVIGSIYHDQMNYGEVNYSDEPWADEPWQSVSYVSCHDNHTLFDKLKISRPDASDEEINKMHKLANAIVLTTQGIAFLHAGVEMMRTKGGEHNSYNKPDEVNRIDWQWKVDHRDIFEYYQNLIALRKNHPGFRLRTGDQVREHLRFLDPKPGLVGFQISGNPNGEPWNEIQVWYNANVESMSVELNDGDWNIAVLGDQVDESGILRTNGVVKIPKISMLVAYK